ncbi:molybdopterin-guanine dinucleotide biosynthesis protein MobA [Rubellimicrobium rubrum]|uniref:Molybdopterin-guanine dinucleotide biosynthesis protein MobA n=1 Tax=Rubellimicrobium rubrum TaxID=2585369 RepID=A0A5C4ML61_9RHOB|nr:MobQ family relaxase [Rubellimicrobium rubrum]TNC44698.1 molybdopterin-guanine dinucleotide biosynthesis protein MobA [Rubellimicrobium rubrum]
MASYHLSVKTVQRSAGRSATAAIAYRTASRVVCEREGRVHDYRAKAGVEASLLLVPKDAPEWAHDRQALWNAAEARETRSNSVTAREWELALPAELDAEGRRVLVQGFAAELVARYGVAADVAIHAPHQDGDQRNWHAHVLTTTRVLTPEGLTDKTRVLDAKQTGGPEIEHMRARWAELQNQALERLGVDERVDHRSLAAQREAALAHGDEIQAETLDRPAEVKLGPVVSAIERREAREAEEEGRPYEPLTERGAQVHEARAARSLLRELAAVREALTRAMQERVELARETYAHAREEGADRVRAGLAALRAAAQRHGIGEGQTHGPGYDQEDDKRQQRQERARQQERARETDSIKDRLARILGREALDHASVEPETERKRHQAPA